MYGLVANITDTSTNFFMLLWTIIFNLTLGYKIFSHTPTVGKRET